MKKVIKLHDARISEKNEERAGKNEKAVSHVVGYVFSWKPSINEVRTESGGLADYITYRFEHDSDKRGSKSQKILRTSLTDCSFFSLISVERIKGVPSVGSRPWSWRNVVFHSRCFSPSDVRAVSTKENDERRGSCSNQG